MKSPKFHAFVEGMTPWGDLILRVRDYSKSTSANVVGPIVLYAVLVCPEDVRQVDFPASFADKKAAKRSGVA